MARIVKEAEYTARRNEILNAAQNLIYSKGYEQMTIQDILDGLHISRGALYHYFDSKQALLEALIDRMGKEAVQTFLPYVMDPELTAIEKLNRYFEASVRWKTAQKELILNLLHIWYSNDNAFIRQKMTTESLKVSAGLVFEPILRQGIEEEVVVVGTTPRDKCGRHLAPGGDHLRAKNRAPLTWIRVDCRGRWTEGERHGHRHRAGQPLASR